MLYEVFFKIHLTRGLCLGSKGESSTNGFKKGIAYEFIGRDIVLFFYTKYSKLYEFLEKSLGSC